MNINRHNYEELFLLYADNELTAADRKAVEAFVHQNPDLGAELQMLLQTIMPADNISFNNKNQLLKKEVPAALQENMLLLLDGELNAADKTTLEKNITTDAALQKEWNNLLLTKLPAEAVVFANKESLYRKEGSRVVNLPWLRVAAAAVLLGFGIWGGVALFNNGKADNNSSVATGNQNKATGNKGISNDNSSTVQIPQESKQTVTNNNAANNNVIAVQPGNSQKNIAVPQPAVNPVKQNLPQEQNNTVVNNEKQEKPSNNLPKPLYERINNEGSNKVSVASVAPVTNTNNIQLNTNLPEEDKTTNSNGYALTTAYNETAPEEINNNKFLYMDEEKVKKTKLGGFLRKLKRVIERNTNIKGGNGIKVAGFDIAIK